MFQHAEFNNDDNDLVVRVKIVGDDVDGVVQQAVPGVQDHPNSNLELEPGVSPPESKTERVCCQHQAIIICCLLTFYCYIAFK